MRHFLRKLALVSFILFSVVAVRHALALIPLSVNQGGTGLNTFVSGDVPYGTATAPLSLDNNFNYNGSTLFLTGKNLGSSGSRVSNGYFTTVNVASDGGLDTQTSGSKRLHISQGTINFIDQNGGPAMVGLVGPAMPDEDTNKTQTLQDKTGTIADLDDIPDPVTPASPDTSVQFNDGGSFGGSNLLYDKLQGGFNSDFIFANGDDREVSVLDQTTPSTQGNKLGIESGAGTDEAPNGNAYLYTPDRTVSLPSDEFNQSYAGIGAHGGGNDATNLTIINSGKNDIGYSGVVKAWGPTLEDSNLVGGQNDIFGGNIFVFDENDYAELEGGYTQFIGGEIGSENDDASGASVQTYGGHWDSSGGWIGGHLDLDSGSVDNIGSGGAINAQAGNGGSTSGSGGSISLTAGTEQSSSAIGGSLILQGAGQSDPGIGGGITFLGGNGADTEDGGGGIFTAGNGGFDDGNGGDFQFNSGNAGGGSAANGGGLTFTGGMGGGTSGSGGSISLTAGSAQGGDSNGGSLTFIAGTKFGAGNDGTITFGVQDALITFQGDGGSMHLNGTTGLFGVSTNGNYANLDPSALSGDQTFAFPDETGTLVLGNGTSGNCAQWDTAHTLTNSGSPCGSGSGGATTALDNLASVAINTSLLPASDNAIDLGSSSKQWRDLYLTGSSIYLAGFKTLTSAGLTVPTGGAYRTSTSAGNTALLQAYDVDGTAYTTFGTLTANNTPTLDLSDAVTKAGGYIYRAGGTDVPVTDGGTGASTAGGARTNLGSTTVGDALFTLANPSAITFPRINADNSVSALDAATFRTAIGAGTGSGTVTSVSGTSNRITSTGGATPVLDISASYVGQSSITTLGTIATGVWNGTAIANANLANSSLTIGSTSVALGATVTTFSGVTLTTASLGSSTATTQAPGDGSTKVATTAYVDAAVNGTDFKEATLVATTANLVGVYLNGASGVGATFTYTATGTNVIDGVTLALGNRVLVKNQSTTFQNGIYSVTTAGALGIAGVLTRTADFNESADIDSGDTIFVTSGTANTSTTWTYNGVSGPIMGTDAITFVQISGPGSITSGNGITVTGLSIAINTAVTADLSTAQAFTNKDLSSGTNTFPIFNQNTTGSAAKLTTARTLWGQSFDGSGNVTGSLTAVGNITGGAGNMTITAGTGASRTLIFQTTTSGSSATTALTLNADQTATFAAGLTTTGVTDSGLSSGRITFAGTSGLLKDDAGLLFATSAPAQTLTIGTPGTANDKGQIALAYIGSVSDSSITLTPAAGTSGLKTITIPNATDTLVGKATTDVLTNKTITSSTDVLGGVTMTLGSDASNDLYYRNGSGILTRLANGTTGQYLAATTGAPPSWGSPAAGLTIGTSAITGGSSGNVLYNNAGVLGEMTTTGSGTVLALATSPSFTTPALGAATATSIIAGTGGPALSGIVQIKYDGSTTNGIMMNNVTTGGRSWIVGDEGGIGTPGVFTIYDTTSGTNRFQIDGTTSGAGLVTIPGGLNIGAGTATRAPLTFTSGTNLTSAVAGAEEYDGKVFYSTSVASSRQVVETEQFISLTSANTLTSQTAAQPMFDGGGGPANGALTVAGSTTYEFECYFTINAMSTTSGTFGWGLAGTATLTSILWNAESMRGAAAAAGTPSFYYQATATPTAIVAAGTNANGHAHIRGVMRINAGGTVIPEVNLSIAAAATIATNSYCSFYPEGTNTVVNVGNWN